MDPVRAERIIWLTLKNEALSIVDSYESRLGFRVDDPGRAAVIRRLQNAVVTSTPNRFPPQSGLVSR